MPGTDRSVRHLRLHAPDAAAVRHLLPRLEDALRCASLPDFGPQVLLVRRLALGELAHDATTQALALRIEQRCATLAQDGVPGGSPAADRAGAVRFDDALQARTLLALRLARGQATDGWYWPLAVAEFRRELGPAENLRRIAHTLAGWRHAAAAMPAWVRQLVGQGAGAALVAALGEAFAQALMQRAGLPPETGRSDGPEAPNRTSRRDAAPARRAAPAGALADRPAGAEPAAADRHPETKGELPVDARPSAAAAQPMPQAVPRAARTPNPADADDVIAKVPRPVGPDAAGRDEVHAPSPAARPGTPEPAGPAGATLPAGDNATPLAAASVAGPPPLPGSETMTPRPATLAPDRYGAHAVPVAAAVPARPDAGPAAALALAPSRVAGLLFLLPALRHLGLPGWLEGLPSAQQRRWVLQILGAALARLPDDRAAMPDDALRRLSADEAALTVAPRRTAPPARWRTELLRPPRPGGTELSAALRQAASADEQARLWLLAARRWLRRVAGIGLASLVCRPGRVGCTPTHLDIHFHLQDIDLRVRRSGLDQDPGWLPWFGQVVAFHYADPPRGRP